MKVQPFKFNFKSTVVKVETISKGHLDEINNKLESKIKQNRTSFEVV